MNPKIQLKCEVLEFEQRDYTAKTGEARVFTSLLIRYMGKVLKLGVEKGLNLQAMVGKEAVLDIALVTFGESLTPTLRVVATK